MATVAAMIGHTIGAVSYKRETALFFLQFQPMSPVRCAKKLPAFCNRYPVLGRESRPLSLTTSY